MPRNGSGTYSPPAGTAGVSLQPIASVPYNNFLTDISSEMTNSLPTTGVKAMGANLPMGGNKITNMADPSVSTDAATKNYVDNITHGKIVNIQVLTVTGTYTRSANATQGDVYVIGGGAAGGGAQATSAGNASIGAGGGGGGIGISLNIALPATQAFTIGAGGTGVSAANGNNGGVTTFGAISANGGTGGQLIGNTPQAGPNVAGGGQGGTAGSGGTLNFTGQDGSAALLATTVISGSGGNSPWQGGGAPRNLSTAVGANATSFGSGGSGALNGPSQTAKAGGNGAAGAIIIIERT